MNFTQIAFVDASSCTANYVKQFRARSRDGTIFLRRDGKDELILGEWSSAKNLLTKVSNAAAPYLGNKPAKIIMAKIFTLVPNEREEWGKPQQEGVRAWLNLLPSPGAMLFSGIEGFNPAVGWLTVVNSRPIFSAVNLGDNAAVWLVVDVEMPKPDA